MIQKMLYTRLVVDLDYAMEQKFVIGGGQL